jgi:hypothetical protein
LPPGNPNRKNPDMANTRKLEFLKDEFLTLSLFGGLGRSNTYCSSATDDNKNKLRKSLRNKLTEMAEGYKSPVDDGSHAANICEIADAITKEFSSSLQNGRFRLGIAQKCLNL